MFAHVLITSEVPGHKLMLIRTDIDDLIDISAQGARPDFTRHIRLNHEEMERVTHSKAIPNTRWALIDLPDEALFPTHKRKTYYEAIAVFIGFAAISILMLFLIRRKEMQRVLAEYTLRKSRDELESANKRIAQYNENLQAHMRDLHDDVGAKLLTLTHRCKNPENADTARSALMDLRETIHDLGKQGTTVPLAHVLADLRAEMQERTEAANIELQWSQPDPLTENNYTLGFRQRINLVRILREALSNAIRHTGVTKIHIDFFIGDDELRVILCNNGLVEEIAGWTSGTGMRNMRKRAEELDGKIEWTQPPANGKVMSKATCVEISYPLPEKG